MKYRRPRQHDAPGSLLRRTGTIEMCGALGTTETCVLGTIEACALGTTDEACALGICAMSGSSSSTSTPTTTAIGGAGARPGMYLLRVISISIGLAKRR
eukprot:SAG25_NODE_2574_length_1522_cov_3.172874_1_plen_99_part_00